MCFRTKDLALAVCYTSRRTKQNHDTSRRTFKDDMCRHRIPTGISRRKDEQIELGRVQGSVTLVEGRGRVVLT